MHLKCQSVILTRFLVRRFFPLRTNCMLRTSSLLCCSTPHLKLWSGSSNYQCISWFKTQIGDFFFLPGPPLPEGNLLFHAWGERSWHLLCRRLEPRVGGGKIFSHFFLSLYPSFSLPPSLLSHQREKDNTSARLSDEISHTNIMKVLYAQDSSPVKKRRAMDVSFSGLFRISALPFVVVSRDNFAATLCISQWYISVA